MDIRTDHPLRRLFSGLVENTFLTQVGMCDPLLTDYLADLLVDFSHVERFQAVRGAAGKRVETIAAMLSVLDQDEPDHSSDRDRLMYRHIGDYTLFWAGLYPEQLKRASSESVDTLIMYVSQGKRSYALASELGTDRDRPPSSLFRHLSDEFEQCVYGLGLVRKGLEHCDDAPPRLGDLIL